MNDLTKQEHRETRQKPDLVLSVYGQVIQEPEARGEEMQGQPGLREAFKSSLGYRRHSRTAWATGGIQGHPGLQEAFKDNLGNLVRLVSKLQGREVGRWLSVQS